MTTIEFQHKLMLALKHLSIYAYRPTSNAENAHNLLQGTNLKALNYWERVVYETNFKVWYSKKQVFFAHKKMMKRA